MKRKVISVLALTLVVLMSAVLVSCDGWKQVAPDEVVKEVVADIKAEHVYFRDYIEALAERDVTPADLQTTLDTILKVKYEAEWGSDTTVKVEVEKDYISAKVDGPDGKHVLDIKYSDIDLDTKGNKVTGKFSISVKKPDQGAASTHSFDTTGDFTIALKDSITFSSVSYRGTDYDTDNFNKEMEREL